MATAHTAANVVFSMGARRAGEAPGARQRQVACGISQGHFDEDTFAFCLLSDHRLQHGFTGHQRATHVGIQGGWQIQSVDQAVVCKVSQIMARLFRPRTGRTHNGDLT